MNVETHICIEEMGIDLETSLESLDIFGVQIRHFTTTQILSLVKNNNNNNNNNNKTPRRQRANKDLNQSNEQERKQ